MDMFNAQKAEGFFDPVVDATTATCRARLPWWQPEARPLNPLCPVPSSAKIALCNNMPTATALRSSFPAAVEHLP